LRSIPNKLGGVVALVIRILILLIKPFQFIKKIKFEYIKKLLNIIFYLNFILLTFLGGKLVEYPYEIFSKISRIIYFILVLLI
jgi:ubiquinol-cytochrome c reductase cytochrome b subunit